MLISARAVTVAFTCGLACSSAGEPTVETVAAVAAQRLTAQRADDDAASQVYAALTSGAAHHGVRGADMLVKDQRIAVPAIGGSAVPEWLREFDGMPVQLREALRRPPAFEAGAIDRSLFPAGTRFISEREISAAFAESLMDAWARFRRLYKTAGVVSYSDVLVTSDGLDALVYTEAHCGGLCGAGTYVWLHRSGRASPWSIAKGIIRWIS